MSTIKRSIFVQILTASLLPLILIFSMVLITINNIIFNISTDFARETAISHAQQVSEKIDEKFLKMTSFLKLTAENLADIDHNTANREVIAQEMLLALLNSDQDIFSASFVFEPDTFKLRERFFKTYVKQGQEVKEAYQTYDLLASGDSKVKWYTAPVFYGTTYFRSLEYFDYGSNIGSYYIGEVSYPVKKDDRTLGAVAIDLRYENIIRSLKNDEASKDRTVILMSRDGQILYAPDRRFIGSMLADLHVPERQEILAAMRDGVNFTSENLSFFSEKDSFIYVFPIRNDNELFLYFDLPTEQLYQKANTASQVIVTTSILGLILLTASVFFATRNIVKPIKKITKSADQIANGQLDVQFDDVVEEANKSNNEIASLQVALKKMLEQLNQNHNLKLMAIEAKFEKEKTQAESNAKTQFLAKMSHEIRTPMNAIAGMSELLLSENLTKRQQKYVRDIKISSDALLIIINDILDLSKLETGNLQLVPVNYDFPTFIKNVTSIAAFMAKEKNIEFSFASRGKMPKALFGDDIRLRQVLINILSNAIKFTKEGSVRLFVENREDKLVFSITDTGVGIKEEDISQLFQSFKQLDEQKNRAIKGTGLGLSISKSIVDLMEGTIKVESTYGEGSTFKITIPLVEGTQEQPVQEESLPKTFKAPSAKILVVDDNEINLHVASALLEFFGIEADTALSGPEAIEMVKNRTYDMIFMDHMMPEMDGVETTANIRNLDEKCKTLPIIALTANAISGAKEFLITSGMDDFISKPIDKTQLQEILVKWLPTDKQEDQGEEKFLQTELPEKPREETKPVQSAFIQAAGQVQGLDVLKGLQNVTLQQDVYKTTLLRASRQIPFFIKNIDKLFLINDKNSFGTAMLEMRNLLSKLGAEQLAQQATELLNAMEQNKTPFCRKHLPVFTKELETFGKQLGEIFTQAETDADTAAESKEYLQKNLYNLSSLIADKELQAVQNILADLLKRNYDEQTKEKLRKVKEYIDSSDYEQAKSYLDSCFNK